MCGITGYSVKSNHMVGYPIGVLQSMMEVQKHRGPNDSGYAIMDREKGDFSLDKLGEVHESSPGALYFGFNRLSILDLSRNGHQPMYNPEAGVVFMFNGEIYNAFDYKDDLKSRGYNFKSNTDTEVVLNLYLEHGLKGMLERINGMFAIAIYDQRFKKLFLIRDRYGIKPLYVLNDHKYFAFSSEMKSFGKLPGYKYKLDDTNIDEFLLFRNLINRTLFKGIENIEPGMYWAIDLENNITKNRYYDLNSEGNDLLSEDTEQLLETSLKASVKRQMISDVKLGCQLSGGVDSSLITYFANEFVPKGSLETISIIPTEKGFSEEGYMDIVINQLNIDAHKYDLDANYYFDNIDRVTWQFEQPLNHPNTIGIYQLSQYAKEHVTVLLSGEGADEVLAGYSRFATMSSLPKIVRSMLSKTKHNRNSIFKLYPHFFRHDIQMIMGSSFTSLDALHAVHPNFSFEKALTYRKDLLQKLEGDNLLRQRKYEILTYLPDLLMRQDKMSMAHSIENRVPFLDNEFVSMSLNIPPHHLMGGKPAEPKKILKEIARKAFSKEFAYRKKQGFPIPLKKFFSSDLFKERWKHELLPSAKDKGLFNSNILDKWFDNIENIGVHQLDILWLVSGFEIWSKHYLKN